jgi:AGCS family alanine or glycine:cation symporter
MWYDIVVLGPNLLLLLGSVVLSVQLRFVQIRAIPQMIRLFFESIFSESPSDHTIKAHKALFTAMATTIGISNIVGPLMAIAFSGPGALAGYFLATIFGAASTFTEVTFALKFRDPAPASQRIGGPMHYLKKVFHPFFPWLYAVAGFVLIAFWSGTQSNAIASLLSPYGIPTIAIGTLNTLLVIFIVTGGIKRVADVAEKLVPIMFVLYVIAMSWIISMHLDALGPALWSIVTDACNFSSAAGGASIAAFVHTFRWGLAKAFQSNESGIGTATVPHSMADADNAREQGILSIVSVYSNGVLCLLSGIAVLVTNTHLHFSESSFGALTVMFAQHFPYFGPLVLISSAALFAFTSIVGNSYNGSQFFSYAFGRQNLSIYYAITAAVIFFSSLASVDFSWQIVDIVALPVFVPHILGIIILASRHKKVLLDDSSVTNAP